MMCMLHVAGQLILTTIWICWCSGMPQILCVIESLCAGLEAGTKRAKAMKGARVGHLTSVFVLVIFDLILVQHLIHEPIDTDNWRKQTRH